MKKILIILFSFIVLASLASPAQAQFSKKLTGSEGQSCLYNAGPGVGRVVTMACVPILFANIIFWLLMFSGTVALFFLIFGGIKILTSGGDAKNIEAAKKTITWAIIGLVTILLSFGILTAVAQITGVGCIERFGFTSCRPNDSTGDPIAPSCSPRGTACGPGITCCGSYTCRNTAPASQMPDYRCD